jgi:hypothetical protein
MCACVRVCMSVGGVNRTSGRTRALQVHTDLKTRSLDVYNIIQHLGRLVPATAAQVVLLYRSVGVHPTKLQHGCRGVDHLKLQEDI